MKKTAIICILLVLTMVMGLMSVTAFAATTPSIGTFKVEGATVSKSDDTYYYVNKTFTYTAAAGATGYFYVPVEKTGLDNLDAKTLYEGGSAVKDGVPNVDTEVKSEKYYAFADYYEKDGETTFSSVAVLVVDTVAPVLDNDAIMQWLQNKDNEGSLPNSWMEAQKDYALPTEWLSDTTCVTEATAQTEEEGKTVNNSKMLTVRFEYCTEANSTDSKEWESSTDTFDVTTIGWWVFRYVVSDEAGNEVTSAEFRKYVRDTTAPEIELTSTQKKVETSGTKAGESYSIPTPTYTDVSGVEKSYYVVYKLVGSDYVAIYNSDSKEVTKGYEKFISESGVLTPSNSEVAKTVDGKPQYIYKVVYHAEDKNGMSTELELKILTTKPDAVAEAFDAWKIVLICVAVACAIAIVVLIFIKPKTTAEKKPTDRQ